MIVEKNKYGIEEMLIVNEHGRRNEPLDCFKLSLAAVWYAYIRDNEIRNERRKRKKLKEQPPEWTTFWAMFQGLEVVDEVD